MRPTWLAGSDGTAHASWRGLPRTLCGIEHTAERFAWPALRRCPTCIERAKEAESKKTS